jgi:hypothetical protein
LIGEELKRKKKEAIERRELVYRLEVEFFLGRAEELKLLRSKMIM